MEPNRSESTAIATVGEKRIDLDDFKALYYLLNAKPDTEIKLFSESKKIQLGDLMELNDKIHEKLKNHEMVTSMTKVTLVLSNNRIQEFSSWAEFERAKWDSAAYTESITALWEMNFVLPNKKLPQPHTMKLKIGSPLNPSEVFHLFMSQDSHDTRIEMSNFVCKVDFINAVLCNELFTIVADWHTALPKLSPEGRVQKFLRKHPERVRETVRILFLLSALLVLAALTHALLTNSTIDPASRLFIERAFEWILASTLVVYLTFTIGTTFGNWIVGNIGRLRDFPMFEFTKGDRNRIEEIKTKNNRLLRDIGIKLTVSLIILILSFLFDKIVAPILAVFTQQ